MYTPICTKKDPAYWPWCSSSTHARAERCCRWWQSARTLFLMVITVHFCIIINCTFFFFFLLAPPFSTLPNKLEYMEVTKISTVFLLPTQNHYAQTFLGRVSAANHKQDFNRSLVCCSDFLGRCFAAWGMGC